MSDATERLAKAEEDRKTHMGLLSVPIRGTKAWTERERLRMSLGNEALSFGTLEDGQSGWAVGKLIAQEKACM